MTQRVISGGDVTSESAEIGPCLMCVARRIEKPVQQFTMKLDVSGKIIGVDTSNVSPPYSHYLNKVSGTHKSARESHYHCSLQQFSVKTEAAVHVYHGQKYGSNWLPIKREK